MRVPRIVSGLAVVGVCLALSPDVHAALGGTASSVQDDRVRMQGALRQVVRSGPFTLHEMQSASGIVVREYVSDAGTVFAVTWQGATFPDMRQLLGPYFDRYHAEAERLARSRRGHGPLTVDLGDLVVQSAGHNRSFTGRAYLPGNMPQGVGIESIR
ncbi:MAG TPA: DUF2844 domain-containing protein [Vicinamibacterales bacterium]